MDNAAFTAQVASTLLANAITLWFLWGFVKVTRIEQSGKPAHKAPWSALFGLLTGPAVLIIALWPH